MKARVTKKWWARYEREERMSEKRFRGDHARCSVIAIIEARVADVLAKLGDANGELSEVRTAVFHGTDGKTLEMSVTVIAKPMIPMQDIKIGTT